MILLGSPLARLNPTYIKTRFLEVPISRTAWLSLGGEKTLLGNLLSFFAAIVISAAIIPLMIRWAPQLGMVDMPDPRKVHTLPIARVGGIGIVIGALIPVFLWVPLDASLHAYLFGSLVLLVFGTWDDCRELGHYVKFIGQFIAVLVVVYYGDVYVHTLPFMDLEPLSEPVARAFTVIAMVGMINAVNHSDGLDGLAGGLSVLSLGCIAYLAYVAEHGAAVVTIAIAVLGGVLGFLRYNTHPARVFMGDGGSQFLGFTLGFLAVYLVQQVDPALSPALPALFLGLPIVDILAVFAQRVHSGMNWFRATRNHVHHRLLDLGFDHYEAVVIIYSIQTLFIVSALLLRYDADWLILLLYLGVCALLFLYLVIAKHAGWKAHQPHTLSRLSKLIGAVRQHKLLTQGPWRFVALAIPLLFIVVSLLAEQVPRDFGIGASILAVLMVLYVGVIRAKDSIVIHVISYVTAAFVIYLEAKYTGQSSRLFHTISLAYFVALAVAVGLAVRFAEDTQFKTTPMDFLVIFIVISIGILTHQDAEQTQLALLVAKLVVVFYGCELILARVRTRWNPLSIATLAALGVIGFRGLL
jgi:UDP-GlcNAc:undecaprenyl-phosphate GlcNAc-1-phosphate transferase